jgi:hypothetical protein
VGRNGYRWLDVPPRGKMELMRPSQTRTLPAISGVYAFFEISTNNEVTLSSGRLGDIFTLL